MRKFTLPAIFLALLTACSGPPVRPAPASTSAPAFVDAVWTSTDPGAAPGTFRIFLSDGTLVMDSCGETYRLARWTSIGDRRIEWTEDTARIEAEITRLTGEQLDLRLRLVSEEKTETYRRAEAPAVCPDMAR